MAGAIPAEPAWMWGLCAADPSANVFYSIASLIIPITKQCSEPGQRGESSGLGWKTAFILKIEVSQ